MFFLVCYINAISNIQLCIYLAKQTLRIIFMCIMKCSLCKIYRQMFNFTYSIFRIDDNIVNFNNLGKNNQFIEYKSFFQIHFLLHLCFSTITLRRHAMHYHEWTVHCARVECEVAFTLTFEKVW